MRETQSSVNGKKGMGKVERAAGFTLLEVIIAISILTFGLLAVASMQIASIRGNSLAGKNTEGTAWASDRLETLVSLPYTHSELASGAHTDPSPPTGFTVTWNVTDSSPMANQKMVTVTVTWTSQFGTKSFSITHVKARYA